MSMFEYTDPTIADLSSILIYGTIAEQSTSAKLIFTTPVDLTLYGSFEKKNMFPVYKGVEPSKEGYIKLGLDKISNVAVVEIANLSTKGLLGLDVPHHGGFGRLGTAKTENDWSNQNEFYKELYSRIMLDLRSIYPIATGISVFTGVVVSNKEETPKDYSYMYPYSRCSIYFGPAIFNCYFYKSGTLAILGHKIDDKAFDYSKCADDIMNVYRRVLD